MVESTSGNPYENCAVLHPETDQVMFRCNKRRMRWYLDRKLAVQIKEDPPVLRLTFQPKGQGHAGDSYFVQVFKNRCVVCGVKEGLSHHHIVPDCYRRHFPRDSYEFGRWMYDVLLLCIECHERYERFGHELKEEISKEHGIPSSGITNLTPEKIIFMKAAAALERHGDEMPSFRRELFMATVKGYLGKNEVSVEDLRLWKTVQKEITVTPAGEVIVPRLGDIDAFAIRWRRHFMKTMNPRFLPDKWDAERRIYSEPDNR